MFGMKEHTYFETDGSGNMWKFLKGFIPLLWVKQKGVLTFEFKDGTREDAGEYYKIICSDKMADVINRRFNLIRKIEKAGTRDGKTVDLILSDK